MHPPRVRGTRRNGKCDAGIRRFIQILDSLIASPIAGTAHISGAISGSVDTDRIVRGARYRTPRNRVVLLEVMCLLHAYDAGPVFMQIVRVAPRARDVKSEFPEFMRLERRA